MKTGLKAAIALAAIAGGVVAYQALSPRKSDQQLIEEALDAAILAGREGRPGSVLEQLSRSFEINGYQISNANEVARFIRDQKPDVEVQSTVATVEGNSAFIESPVKLSMSGPIRYSGTIPGVRIEFAKEHATRWLVIPDRQWRLTRVEVPAESWNGVMFGL